jgi:hypothetical protein
MAPISRQLQQRLLSILRDEYDECQFFMATSNMLTHRIKDITALVQQENVDFTRLRDLVGEIGLFISNTEKRLLDVDECYTKLVEAMAEEKPRS